MKKKIKNKTKIAQTFSTGWCYQPVLKVSSHRPRLVPRGGTFVAVRAKPVLGGTFSPHPLLTVAEPALKPLTNRGYSPVLH